MNKEPIQVYEVRFGMVYRTEDGLREEDLHMLFMAPDEYAAVLVAADWCRGRVEALADLDYKDAHFGAIKVRHYQIGYYDNERVQFNTQRGMDFFEWKCDYPGSLEDYIKTFKGEVGGQPYLTSQTIENHRTYNPDYGDDRICKCGHPYYRHFDSYEDMLAIGCKYCGCATFKEATPDDACEKCQGHGEISVTSRASGGTTMHTCKPCEGSGVDHSAASDWITKQQEGQDI